MTDKELGGLLDDIESGELERTPAARLLVHAAFDELRLERDAALEREKVLREAIDAMCHELGVPQPGYLAPVANAYEIGQRALGVKP